MMTADGNYTAYIQYLNTIYLYGIHGIHPILYILPTLTYYVTDKVMLHLDKYYLRSDIHVVDLSKNHRTQ